MVFKSTLSVFAFASAVLALPFPEALAQLPGATLECHEACGNLILASRECSDNTCLCNPSGQFMELAPACLDCGWQLWEFYGSYLEGPLGQCNLPTQPTGVNTNTAAARATVAAAAKVASVANADITPAPKASN